MTLLDIITSLLSHASVLILLVLPLTDQQTVHAWEAALQTEIHRSAVRHRRVFVLAQDAAHKRSAVVQIVMAFPEEWDEGLSKGLPAQISSPWDNSRTLRGPNRSGCCCCQFSLRNSFHNLQSLHLAVPSFPNGNSR